MNEKKLYSYIFYITLFGLCFVLANHTAGYDFDLWARLIVGKVFWATGHVLKHDFLSYTPTHIWYDHEWGSGTFCFYPVQILFGPIGLVVLQAIFIFLTFVLCIKTIKLRMGEKYSHHILLILLTLLVYNRCVALPVRCQMFSFLFVALVLYLLERARDGKDKTLWIIPFLTIIWNNLHGGVVSGLGIVFMYAVGEFLCRRPFKKYLIVLACSLPLLVINPHGIKYLDFLFMANTMARQDILEWWGVLHPFHIKNCIPFFVWSGFVFVVELFVLLKDLWVKKFAGFFKELNYTKWILLLVTFYLGFIHIKLIPIFMITAFSFCYEDFYKIVPKSDISKVLSLIFVFILIAGIGIFSPTTAKATWVMYPLKEVEFIKSNGIKGNIITSYGHGSYVTYKLFPHNKVYMDGRYEEVYDEEILMHLKVFLEAGYAWGNILERYPADVILLEKNAPVYKYLEKSFPEWKKVYEGELCGVFVKNAKPVSEYKLPPESIDYYKETMFDTDMTQEFLKEFIPKFMKSEAYYAK